MPQYASYSRQNNEPTRVYFPLLATDGTLFTGASIPGVAVNAVKVGDTSEAAQSIAAIPVKSATSQNWYLAIANGEININPTYRELVITITGTDILSQTLVISVDPAVDSKYSALQDGWVYYASNGAAGSDPKVNGTIDNPTNSLVSADDILNQIKGKKVRTRDSVVLPSYAANDLSLLENDGGDYGAGNGTLTSSATYQGPNTVFRGYRVNAGSWDGAAIFDFDRCLIAGNQTTEGRFRKCIFKDVTISAPAAPGNGQTVYDIIDSVMEDTTFSIPATADANFRFSKVSGTLTVSGGKASEIIYIGLDGGHVTLNNITNSGGVVLYGTGSYDLVGATPIQGVNVDGLAPSSGAAGTVDANLVSIDGTTLASGDAELNLRQLRLISDVNGVQPLLIQSDDVFTEAIKIEKTNAAADGNVILIKGDSNNQAALINLDGTGPLGAMSGIQIGAGRFGFIIESGNTGIFVNSTGAGAVQITSQTIEPTVSIGNNGSDIAGTALQIRHIGDVNGLATALEINNGDGSYGNGDALKLIGSGTGEGLVATGTKGLDAAILDALGTLLSTVDGKVDTLTINLDTVDGNVDSILVDTTAIVAKLPAGVISDLALTDTVDGVQLGFIFELLKAMAAGRYNIDAPATGDITFYKEDGTTVLFVVNRTTAGRTRVS